MTVSPAPSWAADAIFYQIFPDRFAQSERVSKPSNLEAWDAPPTTYGFKGGDLLGIAEHLDYLEDLGITALYLNPIFQSTANHRYHTHDYFRVDPILGGDSALRALLDEAHRRDMRIMLDGVFNHASRGFFQFNHIVENGAASPYLDWFLINGFPLRPYHAPKGQQGYEAWWNLPALPKLNVATPAVREFLLEAATHWIEFGADGWRLDVPSEIDDDAFWQEFRRRVRQTNPQAYLVGEIWGEARRWLQGDQFDSVMNYPLTRALLGFLVGDRLDRKEVARSGYGTIKTLDASGFASEIQRLIEHYPWMVTEVQFNLLGSHDTPRFKTLARGDDSAYRLATLFQMTYPGTPCIYYGDEIGMEGGHDPGCRGGFPWEARHWDSELRDYVRRCIALRREHGALRRGEFRWLHVQGEVVAFGRRLGEDTLIVALNANQQSAALTLDVQDYLDDGALLQSLWGSDSVRVTGGQASGIQIPARSGTVLKVTGMIRSSA